MPVIVPQGAEGIAFPVWEPGEKKYVCDLAAYKLYLSAKVKVRRDEFIAAGVPFQFPDGPGTIQTRDLIDIRNIQTNVTMAIILTLAGETGAVMKFRDTENVEHMMTPAQMLLMGAFAAQQGQAIYEKSWGKEREIIALADQTECDAYDVNAGWT